MRRAAVAIVMIGITTTTALLAARPAPPADGSPAALAAATCRGGACRACKNCKYCGHCKAGGSCSVCAGGSIAPAPPPPPPPPRPRTPAPRMPAPRAPVPAREPVPEAAARPIGPAAEQNGIAVYFSPDGGCTEAIVAEIAEAQQSVKVQAYRLTSKPIVAALRQAHDRGLRVMIVLDSSQQSEKYSDATYFHNAGVPVVIDDEHAIAHNKVILIDDATVITGSFNFSAAAEERNAENLLILRGHDRIADAYARNFGRHLAHSKRYVPIEQQRETD